MDAPETRVDRTIAEDMVELFDESSAAFLTIVETSMSGEAALGAIAAGEADAALISNHRPVRDDMAAVMPLYPAVIILFAPIAPIAPDLVDGVGEYAVLSTSTPAEMGSVRPVDAATLRNPMFMPFIIPEGAHGRMTTERVVTIAVDKILVTRRDLDPTAVYDLVDQIVRLRPAISANRPGLFSDLSSEFHTSRSAFVVRAGAQGYLRRTAPFVYERYSGVAEAIAIRKSLKSLTTEDERRDALSRVRRI